jgi:DNA processing protein
MIDGAAPFETFSAMDTISPPLSETERIDRIRLIRTENIGPVAFRQLMLRFGSATAALDALPGLARRGGRNGNLRIAARSDAEREIDAVDALKGRHLFLGETDYPVPLENISDAPPVLSVLGRADILNRPALGIVGARNASTNGRRFAEMLARQLAEAGLVIVSGLARGIDTAAHKGALESGTVAVLAGGVDVVYPPENAALYEAIRGSGAVVSELPPGTEPMARHFPNRNRIISGLSRGVLVVEAALRSGSLISARLAGEQGRDVFAVPGFPLDPRAKGTNELIRNGATLVESAEDVLDVLRSGTQQALREPAGIGFHSPADLSDDERGLDAARQRILDCLGYSAVSVDEVIRDSGVAASSVWTILLELEIAGRVERRAGNRISLIEP